MELGIKGTAQNVTNVKSNLCFCYKFIKNIYVQLQIVIDLYVSIIYFVRVSNTQVGRMWIFLLRRLRHLVSFK